MAATATSAVSKEAKPTYKDLYEIGEIPPLGYVPSKMYAWAIRKDRHGEPEKSMQIEVVPTWARLADAGSRDGRRCELQRRLGGASTPFPLDGQKPIPSQGRTRRASFGPWAPR
jgi:hypothetical protein